MSTNFYIDESGNTGDLVVSKDNNNFSSQGYFTLVCVSLGEQSLSELKSFIELLKKKYKIQATELKFSKIKHLFGHKIGFVLELLKYIEKNSTFLIEIVDKKYIISTNIVNCLINPPFFQESYNNDLRKEIHLELSQWVYKNVTEDFLIKFTDVSRNPSESGLNELFHDLLKLTKKIDDYLSEHVSSLIEESIDDYRIIQSQETDREAYTYFLPLPDESKKNELIGILPYISSFYNLHARLNALYDRSLSDITLIHDNQSHFDHILRFYHENTDLYNHEIGVVFKEADFTFSGKSSKLEFCDSKDSIGLQISDIFAGLVNKSISYFINKDEDLKATEEKILLQILSSLYYQKSINFVLPKNHNYEIIFPMLESVINNNIILSLMGIDKDKIDDFLLQSMFKVRK